MSILCNIYIFFFTPRYYLFRAWGRVGTTIGNNKIENMNNVSDAIAAFENLYLEKTGNHWENRKNFVKKPGAFYPIDIDYGQVSILIH